ncbi:MAG TPA: NADH-quinone oxidoreductase subunit NuoG [Burkholderiales bacterium]|nr:NADH-quinone oxidoreductase subunit NuoG [Burkholderiales bacterium]
MSDPLVIDAREYPAQPQRNLLELCLELGFDLPYFCWHPALGSVGACRQCAVKQFKDEHDRKGRIVMACMTPATAGTRISIDDPEARDFRARVIEWLMTNHPHDCPVCDEGGECHLQDMTVMTGHTYRRYRGTKRTFRNQYLGPFINHEMNRCITCYRCVRFYRDYAGGPDLQALASKNHVYFGRERDGVLESPFSGNLVEVCPTGVFTDRTLKHHYTRKWDLQNAPSLCVHCATGCNTLVSERYGSVRRILNRYNDAVNGYFLCDRGRFGYDFVNSAKRVRTPLLRVDSHSPAQSVKAEAALTAIADLLRDRERVLGIGSPRASLESNFALRELVGADRFVLGMADDEAKLCSQMVHILTQLPLRTPSLQEVEDCDAVLVLGEDVLATAPRLALALRQSTRNAPFDAAQRQRIPRWDDTAVRNSTPEARSPLFLATPFGTDLEDVATASLHASPDALVQLGFAVAHELDANAPAPDALSSDLQTFARNAAQALRDARRPLVVSGAGCRSEALLEALLHATANIALALNRQGKPASVSLVAPECNSVGLALLGGLPFCDVFAQVSEGRADTLIVLENDLYRRAPARDVEALLGTAQVIVLDSIAHATAQRAKLCLPAATFAEGSGTLVSSEGRAQRFFSALPPDENVRDSWRWLGEIAAVSDSVSNPWPALDAVTAACSRAHPLLHAIVDAAPPAAFRLQEQKIPRQPHRYSGRTAMRAHLSVHERKPPPDPDSALAFSMEGAAAQPPAPLVTHFWAPSWNSCQAVNKFQSEIPGPLRGGPAGVRLFEPAAAVQADYFSDVPAPFQPRPDAWLLLPRQLVFGSDELSMLAPAVAERAGQPALQLNADDAKRLGLGKGDAVHLRTRCGDYRFPVEVDARVAPGTVAVPVGLPEMPWLGLPDWGQLQVVSQSEREDGT